jgi:hypothetical protein
VDVEGGDVFRRSTAAGAPEPVSTGLMNFSRRMNLPNHRDPRHRLFAPSKFGNKRALLSVELTQICEDAARHRNRYSFRCYALGKCDKGWLRLHRANPLAFLASLARAARFNHSPVVRPPCSRPIVFAPRTPRTPSGDGGHSASSESSWAMLLGMDLFSVAFVPLFGVKLRNLHPPSLKIMAWGKWQDRLHFQRRDRRTTSRRR